MRRVRAKSNEHDCLDQRVRSFQDPSTTKMQSANRESEIKMDENKHGSDIICPMYPSTDELEHHARTSNDPRPLIICEYAHAMGNKAGNLKEYWEIIEYWHGLQGGFVWEWKDHGLKRKISQKENGAMVATSTNHDTTSTLSVTVFAGQMEDHTTLLSN